MSDRNYWVFSDDNCKFPAMTKEQIISAIAEATGKTPTSIDDAFVTKIREMNASANLKFWVGTTYQFSALETKEENTLYIITDDDTVVSIEQMSEQISAIEQNLSKIIDGTIKVKNATNATNATTANHASNADEATHASNADVATELDATKKILDVLITSINTTSNLYFHFRHIIENPIGYNVLGINSLSTLKEFIINYCDENREYPLTGYYDSKIFTSLSHDGTNIHISYVSFNKGLESAFDTISYGYSKIDDFPISQGIITTAKQYG